MDAVATMGDFLPPESGGRDAVHVAVFSATSTGHLAPGQHVALVENGTKDAIVSAIGKHIGIVDPFLRNAVPPGTRIWIYLYPRSITGLSHRWSHPAFDDTDDETYHPPTQKLRSEQWLRSFVAQADCPPYEQVIAAAARIADGYNDGWDDDCMHFDGYDAHGDIPAEFWDHVEVVLGRPIRGKRPRYFSCSC